MILITGSTGLVGTHLMLELLLRGEKFKALKRKLSDTTQVKKVFEFSNAKGSELFSGIEWVEGDVTDVPSLLEHLAGCDKIYHCAAVVSYHRKDRKHMYKVNVEGTMNVVNAALECGVKKLCHVSSIASFGRSYNGQYINESCHWTDEKLHTHYGITKYQSELEVWRATQEGLDAVVVNPGFIIGPGDFSRSSPSVFRKIDASIPFYPPGGTGFVAVQDVVKIMITAMNSDVITERYIAVGENRSFKDLFDLASLQLGKLPPKWQAPIGLLHIIRMGEWLAEIFTGRKAIVTRESLKNASLTFYYENEKVKKQFGHQFIPIADAIEITTRFYRQGI